MSVVRTVVITVALGCGGGKGMQTDGGNPSNDAAIDAALVPVDAPIDAPPVGCPAAPTTGDLAYITAGPNLDVIWSEPDGTVRGCTKTDAQGKTELRIGAGSAVTVIMPGSSTTRLLTIAGLQAGDDLFFGQVGTPPTVPTFHATFTNTPVTADRFFYDLGCDSISYAGTSGISATPGDSMLYSPCVSDDGQRINVYAEAHMSTDIVAYAIAANVAVTSPTTSVTLDTWRTDWIDAPVTMTNVPFDC